MTKLPKIKPCPKCGRDDSLGVYCYDSGATYVECAMECGYRGPACTTVRWAVRHHNAERDERARSHLSALIVRAETAEARIVVLDQEREQMSEARALADWHEDLGDVLWWKWPIVEAPYVGSPLGSDWPGYHTFWTPLPPTPHPPGIKAGRRAFLDQEPDSR